MVTQCEMCLDQLRSLNQFVLMTTMGQGRWRWRRQQRWLYSAI